MMAIYLELSARFDVKDKYGSTFKQLQTHIKIVPSRAQLPWKELKTRIIEPNLIIDLKSSSSYVSVMKGLSLLFVDLRVLVRVVP